MAAKQEVFHYGQTCTGFITGQGFRFGDKQFAAGSEIMFDNRFIERRMPDIDLRTHKQKKERKNQQERMNKMKNPAQRHLFKRAVALLLVMAAVFSMLASMSTVSYAATTVNQEDLISSVTNPSMERFLSF